MTADDFNAEMQRLYSTFGEKAYTAERIKLIWGHWRDLPAQMFARVINKHIATSRQAPMPQDLIEAAHLERKRSFDRDVAGAADAMFSWAEQKGLKHYLAENYPGCNSLWEAVQIQIEVNKAQRERGGSDGENEKTE